MQELPCGADEHHLALICVGFIECHRSNDSVALF
jgi:hypothetical protein